MALARAALDPTIPVIPAVRVRKSLRVGKRTYERVEISEIVVIVVIVFVNAVIVIVEVNSTLSLDNVYERLKSAAAVTFTIKAKS